MKCSKCDYIYNGIDYLSNCPKCGNSYGFGEEDKGGISTKGVIATGIGAVAGAAAGIGMLALQNSDSDIKASEKESVNIDSNVTNDSAVNEEKDFIDSGSENSDNNLDNNKTEVDIDNITNSTDNKYGSDSLNINTGNTGINKNDDKIDSEIKIDNNEKDNNLENEEQDENLENEEQDESLENEEQDENLENEEQDENLENNEETEVNENASNSGGDSGRRSGGNGLGDIDFGPTDLDSLVSHFGLGVVGPSCADTLSDLSGGENGDIVGICQAAADACAGLDRIGSPDLSSVVTAAKNVVGSNGSGGFLKDLQNKVKNLYNSYKRLCKDYDIIVKLDIQNKLEQAANSGDHGYLDYLMSRFGDDPETALKNLSDFSHDLSVDVNDYFAKEEERLSKTSKNSSAYKNSFLYRIGNKSGQYDTYDEVIAGYKNYVDSTCAAMVTLGTLNYKGSSLVDLNAQHPSGGTYDEYILKNVNDGIDKPCLGDTKPNGEPYSPEECKSLGQQKLEQQALGGYLSLEKIHELNDAQNEIVLAIQNNCQGYIDYYKAAGVNMPTDHHAYTLIKTGVANGCYDENMKFIGEDDRTNNAQAFYEMFKSDSVWRKTEEERLNDDPFQEQFDISEAIYYGEKEVKKLEEQYKCIIDENGNILSGYGDKFLDDCISEHSEKELKEIFGDDFNKLFDKDGGKIVLSENLSTEEKNRLFFALNSDSAVFSAYPDAFIYDENDKPIGFNHNLSYEEMTELTVYIQSKDAANAYFDAVNRMLIFNTLSHQFAKNIDDQKKAYETQYNSAQESFNDILEDYKKNPKNYDKEPVFSDYYPDFVMSPDEMFSTSTLPNGYKNANELYLEYVNATGDDRDIKKYMPSFDLYVEKEDGTLEISNYSAGTLSDNMKYILEQPPYKGAKVDSDAYKNFSDGVVDNLYYNNALLTNIVNNHYIYSAKKMEQANKDKNSSKSAFNMYSNNNFYVNDAIAGAQLLAWLTGNDESLEFWENQRDEYIEASGEQLSIYNEASGLYDFYSVEYSKTDKELTELRLAVPEIIMRYSDYDPEIYRINYDANTEIYYTYYDSVPVASGEKLSDDTIAKIREDADEYFKEMEEEIKNKYGVNSEEYKNLISEKNDFVNIRQAMLILDLQAQGHYINMETCNSYVRSYVESFGFLEYRKDTAAVLNVMGTMEYTLRKQGVNAYVSQFDSFYNASFDLEAQARADFYLDSLVDKVFGKFDGGGIGYDILTFFPDLVENVTESVVLPLTAGIGTSVRGIGKAFENLFEDFLCKGTEINGLHLRNINDEMWSHIYAGVDSGKISLLESYIMQSANSVGNMAIPMALGYICPFLSYTWLGVSAFGNTLESCKKEGMSTLAAYVYSVATASSEILLEKFMGSMLPGSNKATSMGFNKWISNAFSEAREEVIQTFLDPTIKDIVLFFDAIIRGEKLEDVNFAWDDVKLQDFFDAAIIAMFSSGMTSSVDVVNSTNSFIKYGDSRVIEYSNILMNELMNDGMSRQDARILKNQFLSQFYVNKASFSELYNQLLNDSVIKSNYENQQKTYEELKKKNPDFNDPRAEFSFEDYVLGLAFDYNSGGGSSNSVVNFEGAKIELNNIKNQISNLQDELDLLLESFSENSESLSKKYELESKIEALKERQNVLESLLPLFDKNIAQFNGDIDKTILELMDLNKQLNELKETPDIENYDNKVKELEDKINNLQNNLIEMLDKTNILREFYSTKIDDANNKLDDLNNKLDELINQRDSITDDQVNELDDKIDKLKNEIEKIKGQILSHNIALNIDTSQMEMKIANLEGIIDLLTEENKVKVENEILDNKNILADSLVKEKDMVVQNINVLENIKQNSKSDLPRVNDLLSDSLETVGKIDEKLDKLRNDGIEIPDSTHEIQVKSDISTKEKVMNYLTIGVGGVIVGLTADGGSTIGNILSGINQRLDNLKNGKVDLENTDSENDSNKGKLGLNKKKKFIEEQIKTNKQTKYELLREMCNYGLTQNSPITELMDRLQYDIDSYSNSQNDVLSEDGSSLDKKVSDVVEMDLDIGKDVDEIEVSDNVGSDQVIDDILGLEENIDEIEVLEDLFKKKDAKIDESQSDLADKKGKFLDLFSQLYDEYNLTVGKDVDAVEAQDNGVSDQVIDDVLGLEANIDEIEVLEDLFKKKDAKIDESQSDLADKKGKFLDLFSQLYDEYNLTVGKDVDAVEALDNGVSNQVIDDVLGLEENIDEIEVLEDLFKKKDAKIDESQSDLADKKSKFLDLFSQLYDEYNLTVGKDVDVIEVNDNAGSDHVIDDVLGLEENIDEIGMLEDLFKKKDAKIDESQSDLADKKSKFLDLFSQLYDEYNLTVGKDVDVIEVKDNAGSDHVVDEILDLDENTGDLVNFEIFEDVDEIIEDLDNLSRESNLEIKLENLRSKIDKISKSIAKLKNIDISSAYRGIVDSISKIKISNNIDLSSKIKLKEKIIKLKNEILFIDALAITQNANEIIDAEFEILEKGTLKNVNKNKNTIVKSMTRVIKVAFDSIIKLVDKIGKNLSSTNISMEEYINIQNIAEMHDNTLLKSVNELIDDIAKVLDIVNGNSANKLNVEEVKSLMERVRHILDPMDTMSESEILQFKNDLGDKKSELVRLVSQFYDVYESIVDQEVVRYNRLESINVNEDLLNKAIYAKDINAIVEIAKTDFTLIANMIKTGNIDFLSLNGIPQGLINAAVNFINRNNITINFGENVTLAVNMINNGLFQEFSVNNDSKFYHEFFSSLPDGRVNSYQSNKIISGILYFSKNDVNSLSKIIENLSINNVSILSNIFSNSTLWKSSGSFLSSIVNAISNIDYKLIDNIIQCMPTNVKMIVFKETLAQIKSGKNINTSGFCKLLYATGVETMEHIKSIYYINGTDKINSAEIIPILKMFTTRNIPNNLTHENINQILIPVARIMGQQMRNLYFKFGGYEVTELNETFRGITIRAYVNDFRNIDAIRFRINEFKQSIIDGNIPIGILECVNFASFHDAINPDDYMWSMQYEAKKLTKMFESAATGGGGVYNLWKARSTPSNLHLNSHEFGHSLDSKLASLFNKGNHYFSNLPIWEKARSADAKISPDRQNVTRYSANANCEDFADSIREFIMNRSIFENKYPNRAKVLNEYLTKYAIIELKLDSITDVNSIVNLMVKYGVNLNDLNQILSQNPNLQTLKDALVRQYIFAEDAITLLKMSKINDVNTMATFMIQNGCDAASITQILSQNPSLQSLKDAFIRQVSFHESAVDILRLNLDRTSGLFANNYSFSSSRSVSTIAKDTYNFNSPASEFNPSRVSKININSINSAISKGRVVKLEINNTSDVSVHDLRQIQDLSKVEFFVKGIFSDSKGKYKLKYYNPKYISRHTYTGTELLTINSKLNQLQSMVDMSLPVSQRARQIYELIATNCRCLLPANGDNYTESEHFSSQSLRGLTSNNIIGREGLICAGFASVFKELCIRCDITAEYVRGAVQLKDKKGNLYWQAHAWNVFIDEYGNAVPVDVCWRTSGTGDYFGRSDMFADRRRADDDELYRDYGPIKGDVRNVNHEQIVDSEFNNVNSRFNDVNSMLDFVVQQMDAKHGYGAGIKGLRNYLNNDRLSAVTRANGARDVLSKISKAEVENYVRNYGYMNNIYFNQIDKVLNIMAMRHNSMQFAFRQLEGYARDPKPLYITSMNGAREIISRIPIEYVRQFVNMYSSNYYNEYAVAPSTSIATAPYVSEMAVAPSSVSLLQSYKNDIMSSVQRLQNAGLIDAETISRINLNILKLSVDNFNVPNIDSALMSSVIDSIVLELKNELSRIESSTANNNLRKKEIKKAVSHANSRINQELLVPFTEQIISNMISDINISGLTSSTLIPNFDVNSFVRNINIHSSEFSIKQMVVDYILSGPYSNDINVQKYVFDLIASQFDSVVSLHDLQSVLSSVPIGNNNSYVSYFNYYLENIYKLSDGRTLSYYINDLNGKSGNDLINAKNLLRTKQLEVIDKIFNSNGTKKIFLQNGFKKSYIYVHGNRVMCFEKDGYRITSEFYKHMLTYDVGRNKNGGGHILGALMKPYFTFNTVERDYLRVKNGGTSSRVTYIDNKGCTSNIRKSMWIENYTIDKIIDIGYSMYLRGNPNSDSFSQKIRSASNYLIGVSYEEFVKKYDEENSIISFFMGGYGRNKYVKTIFFEVILK